MEIDCLAVDLMRMKALMQVAGAVMHHDGVETPVPKVGDHGDPREEMIRVLRSGMYFHAITVLVGIGGNAAAMDIDKPVVTPAIVEIGMGGLLAIAAQCVGRRGLAEFRSGVARRNAKSKEKGDEKSGHPDVCKIHSYVLGHVTLS